MPGRRRTPRGAVLAVAGIWVSLVAALVTNYATAGPMPEPFASRPWLAWAALGLAGMVSSVLVVRMSAGGEASPPQHGEPPESRSRSRAVDDVRREALERLEIGLPPLRLRFGEAADLVLAPVNDAGHRALHVRPEAEIVSVFDDLRGSMLLVGAPGAGKTTELHRLALALAERARADPREPVPIMLALASHLRSAAWRRRLPVPSRQTIRRVADWALARPFRSRGRDARQRPADPPPLTVEDLKAWIARAARVRYKIPAAVTKRWLTDGTVVLLLDGLDEIPPEGREVMVRLVNELHAGDAAPSVVVTCRSGEYTDLDARLHLEGAVRIESLTFEEVRAYADTGDERLKALRALLWQDGDLGGLVTTPLWLQIAADASGGGPAPRLPEELLARYAQTMIDSRPSPGMPPERARRSLRQLAATDGEDDLRAVYRWAGPSRDATTLMLLHGLPWVGAAVAAAGLALPLARLTGFATACAVHLLVVVMLVNLAREIFGRLPFAPGSPVTGVRHLVAVHATGAALGVTVGGALWLGQWALSGLAGTLPGPARWFLLLSALLVPSGWKGFTSGTLMSRALAGVVLTGLAAACLLLPPLPMFYVELYAAMLVMVLAVLVVTIALVWLFPPADRGEDADGPRPRSALGSSELLFPEAVTSRSILQNAATKRIVVLAGGAGLAMILATDTAGVVGGDVLWSIAVVVLAAVWAVPIAVILPAFVVEAISYLIVRVALPLGGWLPWRLTPILRFGAERDLLIVTLGQYRFRHPLIKQHFAADHNRQAGADAAGYAEDHPLLAARAGEVLAGQPDRLGMFVAPYRAATDAAGIADEPIPVADLPGLLRAETLLVGPPDHGGAIVLAELAAALPAAGEAASPGGLPVLVDVRSWAPPPEWRRGVSGDNPLVGWLATHIAAGHRIPRAMAGRWLRAGRPVLLVDGLSALPAKRRKPLLALFSELCERYAVRYVALSPTAVKGPDAFAILPLPGPVRAAYLTPELLAAGARDMSLWDLLVRPGWLLPIARGGSRHPSRYGFLAGYVAHGLARSSRYAPVQALRFLALFSRGSGSRVPLSPVRADLIRRLSLPVAYVAVVTIGFGLPLAHRYGWPVTAAWSPVAIFAAWLTVASQCPPRLRAAVAAVGWRQRIGYGLAGLPLGVTVGLGVAPLAQWLALAVAPTFRYATEHFSGAFASILDLFATAFATLGWTAADISAWTGPDARVLVMLLYWSLALQIGDLVADRLYFGARLVVRLLVLAAVFLLFDGMPPALFTDTFWLGSAFGAAMTFPALWLRLAERSTGSPADRPRVNGPAFAGVLVVPLLALAVERGLLPAVPDDLRRLLLGVPLGGGIGAVSVYLCAPVWLGLMRVLWGPAPFWFNRFLGDLRAEGLDLQHPLVRAFVLRIDPDEGLPPPDGPDAAVREALIASVRQGLRDAPADPDLLRRFDAAGGTLTLSGPLDALGAELLRRAEADPTAPVPVLLAPRSFPRSGPGRRRVTSWVADRLAREHGMDPDTAIRWLGEKRLALLIDLDSLAARTPARLRRELWLVTECVTALDLPYALSGSE